jgi:hypothetical protein
VLFAVVSTASAQAPETFILTGSMTNDALSSSFVQLMGISLGTPWEIPNWRTTDVEGTLTENGSLRADTVGDHTLWALVAGKASNNVVLKIVSCPK